MNITPSPGYVTSDGKHFASAADAAHHEFKAHLTQLLHGQSALGIIGYIANHPEQIRDVINEYFDLLEEHPDTELQGPLYVVLTPASEAL